MASLAACLMLALWLLLWLPFRHPRVHRILVNHGPPGRSSLVESGPQRQLLDLRELSDDAFAESTAGQPNTLILFINAHGVSEDGKAYFSRASETSGGAREHYDLDKVLQSALASPAAVKLLILDTGDIESQPERGMVVNEFPKLLEEAVNAVKQENRSETLWVLCSHASLEVSHSPPALGQSVFSYFVNQGLGGAADLNEDHVIDLGELYRFVRANVSSWVGSASCNHAEQTPRLLWGGGEISPRHPFPTVAAASRTAMNDRESLDQVIAGAHSQQRRHLTTWESALPTPLATARLGTLAAPASVGQPQASMIGVPAQVDSLNLGRRLTDGLGVGGASAEKPSAPTQQASPTSPSAATPPPNVAKNEAAPAVETAPQGPVAQRGSPPVEQEPPGGSPPTQGAETVAKRQPKAALPPWEQFAKAWGRRDELMLMDDPAKRPRLLDRYPVYWREIEQRLLSAEHAYRTGADGEAETFAKLLRIERDFQSLADGKYPYDAPQRDLNDTLSELSTADASCWSLALGERLHEEGAAPISPPLHEAIQGFDSALASRDSADLFNEWIKASNPLYDQFSEFRLARQLSSASDLTWHEIQVALTTRRLAERVIAAAVWHTSWVRPQIEQADRLRLAGERALLDRASAASNPDATRLLRQAEAQYLTVERDMALVEKATRLRNEVLHVAPHYVRWSRLAGEHRGSRAPTHEQLVTLLDTASPLSAALDAPAADNVQELHALHNELAAKYDQLTRTLQAVESDVLGQKTAVGDVWQWNILLGTPLPSADLRGLLLKKTAEPGQDSRAIPSLDTNSDDFSHEAPTADELIQRLRWAELEWRLAKLAAPVQVDDGREALKAQRAMMCEDLASVPAERYWWAFRQFGRAIQKRYGGVSEAMTNAIEDRLERAELLPGRLQTLRHAERATHLLDVQQVSEPRQPKLRRQLADLRQQLLEGAWYEYLAWQHDRIELAVRDTTSEEAMFQHSVDERIRELAARIYPDHHWSARPADLRFSDSDTVSFSPNAEEQLALSLVSSRPQKCWIVLHYDPAVLDIRAAIGADYYVQGTTDLLPTDWHDHPPSVELPPNQPHALQLRIRPKSSRARQARLIVKAFGEISSTRHEVRVDLGGTQILSLVVDGTTGTSSELADGIVLHPFPNRTTGYQFQLRNSVPVDRTLKVDLFAIPSAEKLAPIPEIEVSEERAAAVMRRIGLSHPIATVVDVKFSKEAPQVPLRFSVPGQPTEPSENAQPPAAAEPQTDTERQKEKPPPGVDVKSGMLLVVTEPSTGRVSFYPLRIAPQRPRRYVHPTVSYDPKQRRILVRVDSVDPSRLPPDGAVVRCQIEEEPWRQSPGRFESVVKGPAQPAMLFVDVPPAPGRAVTLHLSVDDYPRAFVYRVPCDERPVARVDESALLRARITNPTNLAISPPVAAIPVSLQVDSPPGTFDNGDDFVEVGIDVGRDRELRQDSVMRMFVDRQVAARMAPPAEDGLVSIATEVRDFELALEAAGVQNSRVGIQARVSAGARTAWSDPVNVTIDGTPPEVQSVAVRPDNVLVVGSELEVSVVASDDDLSGIAKVEVALDTKRMGVFVEDPPPVVATRLQDGRWRAKLPTENLATDVYAILVRATDFVGNQSPYDETQVRLLSAEAVATVRAARTNRVSGTVVHGKEPVPGVLVEALNEKNVVVAAKSTGARGQFVFPEIRVGQYKLRAQGVRYNKLRSAETPITVAPPPARLAPVELTLK